MMTNPIRRLKTETTSMSISPKGAYSALHQQIGPKFLERLFCQRLAERDKFFFTKLGNQAFL